MAARNTISQLTSRIEDLAERRLPRRGPVTIVGADEAECRRRLKEIEAAGEQIGHVRFIVTGVQRGGDGERAAQNELRRASPRCWWLGQLPSPVRAATSRTKAADSERGQTRGNAKGRPRIAPALEKAHQESAGDAGTAGVRVIAKQFGVDPGTVEQVSRPFEGGWGKSLGPIEEKFRQSWSHRREIQTILERCCSRRRSETSPFKVT